MGEPHSSEPPHQREHSATSLLRSWGAVAVRPSRHVFAARTQDLPRQWIHISLALGIALWFVSQGLTVLRDVLTPSSSGTTSHALFGTSPATARLIFTFTVGTLTYVVMVLAFAYAMALVMPAAQATIRQRFQQVLGPWSLAQPALGAIGIVAGVLSTMVSLAGHGAASTVSCVRGMLAIGTLIYVLSVTANSLSVGSGRSRLVVLGVTLLTASAVYWVLWYIPSAIILRL